MERQHTAIIDVTLVGQGAAPEALIAATDRITMTMRELDRFKVIQDVADGKRKPWPAAERLRLTTRQIRRLVATPTYLPNNWLLTYHTSGSEPGDR
jgi:hypothetical protein